MARQIITIEIKLKSVIVHAGHKIGAKRSRYSHEDVEIYQIGKVSETVLQPQAIDHAVLCALQDIGASPSKLYRPKGQKKPKKTEVSEKQLPLF